MDYEKAAPSLSAGNGICAGNASFNSFKDSELSSLKQTKPQQLQEDNSAFSEGRDLSNITNVIRDEMTKSPTPRWEETFLDYCQPLTPAPPALISINGTDVAFRDGITTISGADKSGKSTFIRIILAAILSGTPILGVEAKQGRVVLFDTEQPDHRILRLADNAFRLAGKERAANSDFIISRLRRLPSGERLRVVEETIEDIKPDIVIIDGVADLIPDINDLIASTELTSRLLTIASTSNVVIIAVIHTNPNDTSGKLRGHLGSELMRKCETSILLEKNENGVFTCRCKESRGKPFDAFSFQKDNNDNLFLVEAPKKTVSAPDKMVQVMEPEHAYCYSELVNLTKEQGVKESTAKYAIKQNLETGRIYQDEKKKYHLKGSEQVSQFSLIKILD